MTEHFTQERYDARRVELHMALQQAEEEYQDAAYRAETGEGTSAKLAASLRAVEDIKGRQAGLEEAWKRAQQVAAREAEAARMIMRAEAAVRLRALRDDEMAQADNVAAAVAALAAAYARLIEISDGMLPLVRPFLLGQTQDTISNVARAYDTRWAYLYIAGALHKAGLGRLGDVTDWAAACRPIDAGLSFGDFVRQGGERAFRLTEQFIPELRVPSVDHDNDLAEAA